MRKPPTPRHAPSTPAFLFIEKNLDTVMATIADEFAGKPTPETVYEKVTYIFRDRVGWHEFEMIEIFMRYYCVEPKTARLLRRAGKC